MEEVLRIAIIGDFNFAYNSHNATNQALQHVEKVLDQPLNFYWLNEKECCEQNEDFYQNYDGVIIAPGPYRQPFYFNSIISKLLEKDVPVLGTGDCFKLLVETYFKQKGFDLGQEKIISDNLIDGNQFTGITLEKLSDEFSKLYMTKGNVEYSSSRYSILPQYSDVLNEGFEIGARNQYFDPEILKSRTHSFFLFTMFCPQVLSTSDMPHPIFTYFIKNTRRIFDIKATAS
ncbi:MAG: CTP synthase (UTP-ammonia lyase) [Arenicella sp.]|jgi:CTP synthase (UTP-ammonia lyase)